MVKLKYLNFICLLLTVLILTSCSEMKNIAMSSTDSDILFETDTEIKKTFIRPSKEEIKKNKETYPVISISSDAVAQGGFLLLKAKNIDEKYTYTDFFGRNRDFIFINNVGYSFIPIDVSDNPGIYELIFDFDSIKYTFSVEVLKVEFETQDLDISEDMAKNIIENSEVRHQFVSETDSIFLIEKSEPLWDGEFINPLKNKYKVTTPFGTFRTFSNGYTEYHNAIDMATAGGTPVYAPNNGKVLYAGFLDYTGNTVVIDYGMGIRSWFFHLKTLNVKEGVNVSKNQVVAMVGSTGLSTGNHLHFGMSVEEIFIDPNMFIGFDPKTMLE